MKVTLSKPIEAHGEKVKELTFREMTAGDLRGINLTIGTGGLTIDAGDVIDLGAKLADVPPSSMNKLAVPDLVRIAEKLGPLLDGFLPTGPTS